MHLLLGCPLTHLTLVFTMHLQRPFVEYFRFFLFLLLYLHITTKFIVLLMCASFLRPGYFDHCDYLGDQVFITVVQCDFYFFFLKYLKGQNDVSLCNITMNYSDFPNISLDLFFLVSVVLFVSNCCRNSLLLNYGMKVNIYSILGFFFLLNSF